MAFALTAAVVASFALIHLYIGQLRFLDVIPRSRWLSFSGGVAAAYVFLHILPELSGHQRTVSSRRDSGGIFAESEIYLMGLAGLATFYGLERMLRGARESATSSLIFQIHLLAFALYNFLIGYLLLHRQENGIWSLTTYSLAMALHFVTTDFGLRKDHGALYDRLGRWMLAGAVAVGWCIGFSVTIGRLWIGLLFAFLAGGVILNVMKEELPEQRASRFPPFALGALGSAVLLLLTSG